MVRFNWAARKLHKRVLQLGANEIYARGEADEQHEEGYYCWARLFRSEANGFADLMLPSCHGHLTYAAAF